jgi:glycosyltransferase involved in cell wall biosynthesis
MRVLYCVEDYPILSETYVETELDYFLPMGVEVAVWCRDADPRRPRARVKVYDGELRSAVRDFRPDLLHVHWVVIADGVARIETSLPITVRAHSFEFKPHMIRGLMINPKVRAIWMFPNLRDEFFATEPGVQHKGTPFERKVRPLVAAYSETLFYPSPKERGTVIRAAAGLKGKDLETFVRVAKLAPEAKFTLIVSKPKRIPNSMDGLKAMNKGLGSPARILEDVPRTETAAMVRSSEMCLRSHDPNGHPYGSPISASEAMATGAIVIARNCKGARRLLGAAGLFFTKDQEAAALVKSVLDAPRDRLDRLSSASISQAAPHASRLVLPEIMSEWRSIAGK